MAIKIIKNTMIDPIKMTCECCKRCDPYGPNVPENHRHCLMNCEMVGFDDIACDHYIANE